MSKITLLFIQSSHFVLGSGLTLLLSFISFPILTRVFTREQYGIAGLAVTTMSIVVAISKMGLSEGIIRFYPEYSETFEGRNTFSSTVILRGIVFSSLSAMLFILIFPVVRPYLGIDQQYLKCFIIMTISLFVRPLNIIVLNLLRVNGKTLFMNIINIIGRVAQIGLSLVLFIFIIREYYGYFIGLAVSELVVAVLLARWFFMNYKLLFSGVSQDLTIKLIKFGLPLFLSELSYLLLSYFDRFMLVIYHGENILGLYSAGYNLAMYIGNMLTFSLNYAVVPIYVGIFHREGKEKTEEFLSTCFYYFALIIIPVCFGYAAVSKDTFTLLASEKYATAATFSPIILLGTISLGLNGIFNAGLYLKKKTSTIFMIMLTAVVTNVIMNMFLIPEYKALGAAYATLLSCLLATFLTIVLSFKHIFVKMEYKSTLYYLSVSIIMYFVVTHIGIKALWIRLFSKVLVGFLVVASGVLLNEKQLRSKLINIRTGWRHKSC